MPKPIQYLKKTLEPTVTKTHASSNHAVYTLPSEDGSSALILVECAEGRGNVPRNASTFQDLKLNLQKEMEAVARVAQTAADALRRISPGGVELEFGVELGGSAGIPMITKSEAKANFRVTLKWPGNSQE